MHFRKRHIIPLPTNQQSNKTNIQKQRPRLSPLLMMRNRRPITKRPRQYPLKLFRLEPIRNRIPSLLSTDRASSTKSRRRPLQALGANTLRSTSASCAPRRVFIFLCMERFAWEQDSAIKGVGQTTMTATNLHGDDDEFGQGTKLRGEGGVAIGVAERETDGAVGGDDFEEDGEEAEGNILCVLESGAFDDGDEEEAQEDEPEIKG